MHILSEKELASELGISPWTIRGWRLSAGLPHFRTAGRIFYRMNSVLAWMDREEERNSNLPLQDQVDNDIDIKIS